MLSWIRAEGALRGGRKSPPGLAKTCSFLVCSECTGKGFLGEEGWRESGPEGAVTITSKHFVLH